MGAFLPAHPPHPLHPPLIRRGRTMRRRPPSVGRPRVCDARKAGGPGNGKRQTRRIWPHPTRRFLYAINEIEHRQGLPRARPRPTPLCRGWQRLRLLNRQPLSIQHRAGAFWRYRPTASIWSLRSTWAALYNVLPIQRWFAGRGVRHQSRKPAPARVPNSNPPTRTWCCSTGQRVLAGRQRLHQCAYAGRRPYYSARTETACGSGPRHLALYPDGALLYVVNELDASVSCHG